MRAINFSFFIARYVFFALFTICNAIICSVAVWNHSLVVSSQALQIGVYLIFLGALSLASIFTLLFVELLCIDPFTTRVWFECGWIALFWIMELGGAAAVAAIEPDLMCSSHLAPRNATCTSGRVLLAFTWICTIILVIYLVTLVVLAVSQHHHDPEIWFATVRTLFTRTLWRLPSAPSSPAVPLPMKRTLADNYTAQPMRSEPPSYLQRGGLNPEYVIEPFRPSFIAPEQMDIPFSPTLPEAIPYRPPVTEKPLPALVKPVATRALPPTGVEHTASAWRTPNDQFGVPQSLPSSIVYATSNPLSAAAAVSSHSASLPSPSPLGDWPRSDIMQQPVKPRWQKRKPPPPSAFEFPKRHGIGGVSSEQTPISEPLSSDPLSQPRTRRPSGPRMRVPSGESMHRPAPLDLSRISNHR